SQSEFTRNSGRCRACVSAYNKEYQAKNKLSIKKQRKQYYDDNRDVLLDAHRTYYAENAEALCAQKREYYEEHTEEILIRNRIYYENNKDDVLEYHREYHQIRKDTDPTYRLRKTFSTIIYYSLKNKSSTKNDSSCLTFLPYTMQELREHLEAQFESWMN